MTKPGRDGPLLLRHRRPRIGRRQHALARRQGARRQHRRLRRPLRHHRRGLRRADVTMLPYEWGQAAQRRRRPPRAESRTRRSRPSSSPTTRPQPASPTRSPRSPKSSARPTSCSLVDAVSSLGAIPLRHGRLGPRLVVTGSQKGWMVPPGLAFVCPERPRLEGVRAGADAALLLRPRQAPRRARPRARRPSRRRCRSSSASTSPSSGWRVEGLEAIFTRHKKMGAT